jgi:hypothetical protein
MHTLLAGPALVDAMTETFVVPGAAVTLDCGVGADGA